MTWKEFKEAIEAQGVKDDDELWYIDVHAFHVTTNRRTSAKSVETEASEDGWAIWS